MRTRSISPIIASFMALRVSGRLRVRVTMLSCRWYRTDPFVIRELLGNCALVVNLVPAPPGALAIDSINARWRLARGLTGLLVDVMVTVARIGRTLGAT